MRVAVLLTLALGLGAPAWAQGPTPVQTPATQAESREANLSAYAELLRSDLRTQKVAIITELMQFSEDEDAKFWPVYREYELELSKINDARLALIVDYATAYDKMTDAIADTLATRSLELEARRHALKERYFARFKTVLPTVTAVRFFQVENQILLLLDLQIAASLPVMK